LVCSAVTWLRCCLLFCYGLPFVVRYVVTHLPTFVFPRYVCAFVLPLRVYGTHTALRLHAALPFAVYVFTVRYTFVTLLRTPTLLYARLFTTHLVRLIGACVVVTFVYAAVCLLLVVGWFGFPVIRSFVRLRLRIYRCCLVSFVLTFRGYWFGLVYLLVALRLLRYPAFPLLFVGFRSICYVVGCSLRCWFWFGWFAFWFVPFDLVKLLLLFTCCWLRYVCSLRCLLVVRCWLLVDYVVRYGCYRLPFTIAVTLRLFAVVFVAGLVCVSLHVAVAFHV